jgi:hydrogenase maturation factor
MERVVFKQLGSTRRSVIVRPGQGRDNAVLSLPGAPDKVMVITADPLSIIPSLGMEESAWLTAHLLASDLATSGVAPQFAVLDFNLPPELDMKDFEVYLKSLSSEFRRIGITTVGGHTGSYPGCDYTIAGGGVMFSFANRKTYVTPSMARAGDAIIITKGAAIATTGILARAFPNRIRNSLGESSLRKAQGYLRTCSTVKESLLASHLRLHAEITSMHDATEGGVIGGLYELAFACGKAVVVDPRSIYVSAETKIICSLFGLDPLVSLSEGTLIITCRPEATSKLRELLSRNHIATFAIGHIGRSGKGLWNSVGRGETKPLVPPAADPYWDAYSMAVEDGWN